MALRSIVALIFFLIGAFGFGANALAAPTVFSVDPTKDQLGRRSVEGTLRVASDKALFYIEEDFFIRSSEAYRKELDEAIRNLAKEFDGRIFPELEKTYGSSGLSSDDKLTVLLFRARPDIGGYFDKKNFLPKARYSASNERPMVYLNVFRVTHPAAPAYLAHEFQHLITYYQKEVKRGLQEEKWLDEMYSEYAASILGYNEQWNGSLIEGRVYDFQQNVETSLLGWGDHAANHGAASLFAEFLAAQYGEKILQDAFLSSRTGIDSIEYALAANNIQRKFWEVYNQWLVANYINNTLNGDSRYAYPPPLTYDRFHVLPSVNYRVGIQGVTHRAELEDWSSSYVRVTPVVLGGSQVLEAVISAEDPSDKADIKVPFVINYFSGNTDVRYVLVRNKKASVFVNGFGKEVSSVVFIPTNQYSATGFETNGASRRVRVQMDFSVSQPRTISERIESIKKQISALLEQVSYLRGIRTRQEAFRYTWKRDLFFGMSNNSDVKALQKALTIDDVYSGPITGNFLFLTREAVIKFQKKYGIEPSVGYVGPLTRGKLNELFGR